MLCIALIFLSLILTMLFLIMKHPLTMGVTLLIQTIIISLITGLLYLNFWFSYILFLIMVGGMLVLFVYMTSIASNEKFKFSLFTMLMIMILISIFLLLWMNMDLFFSPIFSNMENFYSNNLYQFSLNKFINFPMINIFFMIIVYLLITLIAVVKITNIKIGPLRPSI